MSTNKLGINSICVHTGEIKDQQYKGAVSPIYVSTSFAFDEIDEKRYPRYYNTPNQQELSKKIAALENTENGMIFSSGMAAISHSMMAFLKTGDHVILQQVIYGGTFNFVVKEFEKFGIEYTFTDSSKVADFKNLIQKNTRIIYIETPSNPLLGITDLQGIADLAKENGIMTMIDNTFASPINQNPSNFGIDIVAHSATKYMGGHSDICAGAVAASNEHIEQIWNTAINYGGNLSDYTVWLLERSLKTLNLRVKEQTRVAQVIAEYLESHKDIDRVYYPGLQSHEDFEIAKKQMKGFGAMLSFELKAGIDPMEFQRNLEFIKPSMSLAGLETTTVSPTQTTHALLSEEERLSRGIKNGLIRFSTGIEEPEDLIKDLERAIHKTKK